MLFAGLLGITVASLLVMGVIGHLSIRHHVTRQECRISSDILVIPQNTENKQLVCIRQEATIMSLFIV